MVTLVADKLERQWLLEVCFDVEDYLHKATPELLPSSSCNHNTCIELHTYNLLHTIRQPVMSNQEQPCSAGASGPAMQQQPLLYPTPQQNVVTSAPRVFCHSAPGVQPQVLPYQEQPTATFTQPYVVCL